jgi:hypothetical protein
MGNQGHDGESLPCAGKNQQTENRELGKTTVREKL